MSNPTLPMRWYVLQARAGYESRAVHALKEHIKLHQMEAFFGEILVPTEAVIEMRGGHAYRSDRKFFPGYILVHMVMTEETWHLIRAVPRISGFVGGRSDAPAPISNKEADAILTRLNQGKDNPRPKTIFEAGEVIRIKEGPFADFNGMVEKVDYEKSRLTVSVSIFGRSTPVELTFAQIEKL